MTTAARVARALAAHRTGVYLVALGVVAGARFRPGPLAEALSPGAATALVGVALGAMAVTYLAELAVGAGEADRADGPEPARTRADPPARARLLVGVGLAGAAVGGGFALAGHPLVGGPFLLGAALVVRAGVRRRTTDDRQVRG